MSNAASMSPLRAEVFGLFAQGRGQEAFARLQAAARAAPADPDPPTVLAACLLRLGRPAEAGAALDRALTLDPRHGPALHQRGLLKQEAGDLAGAARDFEAAVEARPDYLPALADLAETSARRGDSAAARGWAARALALDPSEPVANLALISADLRDRAHEAAARRSRAMLATGRLTPQNRAIALGQLADALDGLGRYADAFSAYRDSNEVLRALYAPQLDRPEAHMPIGHARRLAAWFEAADPEVWRRPSAAGPSPARAHVFLVGFPRSGTTLLEQVLAGHPDVVALEEKGTLEDALAPLFVDESGLARLAAAGAEALEPCRRAYWDRVRSFGVAPEGRVFIDKMPLNTVLLPLIWRLFPEARILFAVRDPRDVALSCFRRRFGMNPAMYQFLTLEGAAAYYDAVMRLGVLYRDLLPLALREVRYERLVQDFASEAPAIAGFLGLDWTEAMADVAATARRREVDTPSSVQVAQGLYREGVAQWRRYEAQLSPVMPILEPWAARLGYT